MKKLHLHLLLLSLLCSLHASAQELEWHRVTTTSEIDDSSAFVITFRTDQYYHTLVPRLWNEALSADIHVYDSNGFADTSYPAVAAELIGNTTTFRFEQAGGRWLMRNMASGKYVGCVSKVPERHTECFNLFRESNETADNKDFTVTFEQRPSGLFIKIGGLYLTHQEQSKGYRLKSKCDAEEEVELYKGTVKQPEKTMTLNENEDLATVENFEGSVSFVRTFYDGYYNTLVLPFDVEDYRQVFGAGTTAYQLRQATAETLSFVEVVPHEPLRANRPYLLRGTFGKSPYTVTGVNFGHNEADADVPVAAGSVVIHCLYRKQTVGGSNYYILWKDGFYRCTQLKSNVAVEPYKWLVAVDEANKNAVRLMVNGSEVLNAIVAGPEEAGSEPAVYNLQGIRQAAPWRNLPSGIYITGGRKAVRK